MLDGAGKSELNYYPHHIGDYARDTAHLSMLEDAAYRRMLDLYYASERPLPKNRDGLYRLVRAKSSAEKLAVDVVLGEFFEDTETGWRQRRVEVELEKGRTRIATAQANGRKGGRTTQREPSGNPAGSQSGTQGLTPINQKPKTKEQDAPPAPPNGGSTVWDFGKSILTEQGLSLKAAGGLIGSWLKDWDEPTVADALRAAAGKADARGYVIAILNSKVRKGATNEVKVDL